MSKKGGLRKFIAGAALGAGLGLLFAPDSGENTRKVLKKKLDAVNCISIDNSYPVNIGFQRSLLSKFYYTIFDEPIIENDSLMRIYDSKCMYIFYRDNVVLQYGSGAIGSICFPKRFLE